MTAAVLSLLASSAVAAMPALARTSMEFFQVSENASTSQAPMPVYFGNGCFWGRQKDFVDAEKSMGRSAEQISSVVGYAGGRVQGGYAHGIYALFLTLESSTNSPPWDAWITSTGEGFK